MANADQSVTAVEALYALVTRSVDAEAAQALIEEATLELTGRTDSDADHPAESTAPGENATASAHPLVLQRVVEHALRRPVACPQCQRTAICRCTADRTEGRVHAVLNALAPWLCTSISNAPITRPTDGVTNSPVT
ncbi:MAG TPA: hypothetical protein VIU15_38385 [Streptomyces sp.]